MPTDDARYRFAKMQIVRLGGNAPMSTRHSAPDLHVFARSVSFRQGCSMKGFGGTEKPPDLVLLGVNEHAMRAASFEAVRK
jgi:hypothetical protein